jgi:aspartate racemase
MVIDQVWMDRFAALLRDGAESEIEELFLAALHRVHRAGANFAMVAAITPHKFLANMRDKVPLPVLDIVEATRQTLCAAGYRKIGILGTRLTLTDRFFREPLEASGILVQIPDEPDIAYLDKLIFGDLAAGQETAEMRRQIAAIIDRMSQRAAMECIVVACTDLFDLMNTDIPLVDPIDCHIDMAGKLCGAT